MVRSRHHKVAIVLLGYAAALAAAWVAVAVYVSFTAGPDRHQYDGMYAFGDMVLFLAVFGLAALPATGLALFYLRGNRTFWNALAVASLAVAATALAAAIAYFVTRAGAPPPWIKAWATASPILVLAAPVLALVFLVAGLLAPARAPRIAFLIATALEVVVFVSVVSTWLQPARDRKAESSPFHRSATSNRFLGDGAQARAWLHDS